MNFQVSKVSIRLLVIQAIFLLLKIQCAFKLKRNNQLQVHKLQTVQPTQANWREQMAKMKFDADYTIKIDTSNVDPNYAALCVITKNDNINDISEFLEYHFKIGIGRIYLFDTGTNNQQFSTMVERMANFLADRRLYYSYWNQGNWIQGYNMQVNIYNICAQSFAKNHTWLGYIDTDEFIILRNIEKSEHIREKNQSTQVEQSKVGGSKVQNIQDLLKQYEDYGALTMNWVIFGSQGYQKHQQSALKSYTKCVLHDYVKSFINVRYWKLRVSNVHYIERDLFWQGKFSVDEDLRVQHKWKNYHQPASKIAVFHYVTKSAEDYQVKMQRGDATGHHARKETFYKQVNDNATYNCTEGQQLYNQLFKNTTEKI